MNLTNFSAFNPGGLFPENPFPSGTVIGDGGCYENTLLDILRTGMLLLILFVFAFMIITALQIGFSYINAGGDDKSIEAAGKSFGNIFWGAFLLLIVLLLMFAFGTAFFPDFNPGAACDPVSKPGVVVTP